MREWLVILVLAATALLCACKTVESNGGDSTAVIEQGSFASVDEAMIWWNSFVASGKATADDIEHVNAYYKAYQTNPTWGEMLVGYINCVKNNPDSRVYMVPKAVKRK